MTLSDKEILSCIEDGRIIMSPFDINNLNPNSIDLTLNPTCKIYKQSKVASFGENYIPNVKFIPTSPAILDCRKPNEVIEFEIPEEGFVLQPNTLYLYSCNETIGVPKKEFSAYGHLCAHVEGKSSLGRLGLFIHITAGFIDSGFVGSLVLELHCVQPIRIYPNMKICQVKFEKVYGNILEFYSDKGTSKYMNQKGVQESKMHENFTTADIVSEGVKQKVITGINWDKNNY